MKNTTKKSSPKASHKKAVKDLDVKPAKGGAVRGGNLFQKCANGRHLPEVVIE